MSSSWGLFLIKQIGNVDIWITASISFLGYGKFQRKYGSINKDVLSDEKVGYVESGG
jgi:hypothetical protein